MQISMHAQWLPLTPLPLLLLPPLTAVAASSSNRQTTQTVSASASTFYLARRKINLSAVCTAHPLKHTHTHTQLQQLTTTTTNYNYNKLRQEQQRASEQENYNELLVVLMPQLVAKCSQFFANIKLLFFPHPLSYVL